MPTEDERKAAIKEYQDLVVYRPNYIIRRDAEADQEIIDAWQAYIEWVDTRKGEIEALATTNSWDLESAEDLSAYPGYAELMGIKK